jgi:hypothetical protein
MDYLEYIAVCEQVKDRRAMRQTILHRIECAAKRGSPRERFFEGQLKNVEQELSSILKKEREGLA